MQSRAGVEDRSLQYRRVAGTALRNSSSAAGRPTQVIEIQLNANPPNYQG